MLLALFYSCFYFYHKKVKRFPNEMVQLAKDYTLWPNFLTEFFRSKLIHSRRYKLIKDFMLAIMAQCTCVENFGELKLENVLER